jgi:hypothetical protein
MSRVHDSLRKLVQKNPEAVTPAYASSASSCRRMSAADQSLPAAQASRRVPLAVRLSPEFVNSFCLGRRPPDRRKAEYRPAPTGLLFGTMQDGIVTVRAAKVFPTSLNDPVSADNFSKFWAIARSDPELASLDLVGWCAVQQAVGLLPNGIDFHNRHFRRLSDVALLVTPERKAGFSAGLYTKSGDGVLSRDNFCCAAQRVTSEASPTAPVELTVSTPIGQSSYLKIYESGVPEKGGHRARWKGLATVFRRPKAIACPEPPMKQLPLPAVERERAPRRAQRAWFLAALAIFAGICGGALVYLIRHPKAPATETELAYTVLNLKLTEQGGWLLVSWDRRNPAVEAAIGGDLQIEDGGRHIHIQLDAEQIKEGSVGYKANSADLTFRLKLRSKGGETTVAILRSVDGTAPKTAANPTPANLPREELPPTPPAAPVPHPASMSASSATTHVTVRVPRALDAFAHPPVVPLSELAPGAQKAPKYMPELPGLPPFKTPAVNTSETVNQFGAPRNIAPVQTVSAPVRTASVSPAYIPPPPSPPHPLRQVMPPATPAGVILYKDVRVQIQVSVDERGRVIAAHPLASPEKMSQSLLGVALNAATQWQFQPATLHGRAVGSEYTIVFQFHSKQY